LTLERAGYIVHRARDGEEALDLVRRECPDVAVLDVAMPKLDGFELTRRLRHDPDTSEVRIVLLTARVQETDTDAGLAAGAHDYIPKPFSPQELQDRVAALLRRA
jgi:DNA-binding response OmpR family regulator